MHVLILHIVLRSVACCLSQYMLDLDMVKMLPRAYDDFIRCFKLPSILPGGSNCLMNAVSCQCALFFPLHRVLKTHHDMLNVTERSILMVDHLWAPTFTSPRVGLGCISFFC